MARDVLSLFIYTFIWRERERDMEGGRKGGKELRGQERGERENANESQSKTSPFSVAWILGLVASTFTRWNILLVLFVSFKKCLLSVFCDFRCISLYSHLTDNVLHLCPPGATVSGICFLSSHLRLFIGSVQSSNNFLVLTFVFSDFEFVLVQIVASVQNLQSSLHMRSPGFLRLKITLTLLILFQCGF